MVTTATVNKDKEIYDLPFNKLKTSFYQQEICSLFKFLIPEKCRVLELGCGRGHLLARLKPSYGLGIDIDKEKINIARKEYSFKPELKFILADADNFNNIEYESFDYIIASDLTGLLKDVQKTFSQLHPICKDSTRLIIQLHSNVWRPVLSLYNFLRGRKYSCEYNWLSIRDIKNLLYLSGFEVITEGGRILFPFKIPILDWFFNRLLAKLPITCWGCLAWYVVARPFQLSKKEPLSVSIVIPTRNEVGNIESIFVRTPRIGKWTELIFIDGNSTDGTVEAIKAGIKKYGSKWERVVFLKQTGKGKGQAVHQGFSESRADILMILDSDLTMPPEELFKYYEAIIMGKGEFINGCRLVYPMQKQAMQFLNMIANHMFAMIFTWFLGQPIKDTLCGTKVLERRFYNLIYKNRSYFGDFDPFGDFDLLFGAAKLNLKIVDMPIRYQERSYGDIKIQRWRHGLLLLRMSLIAFRKLKLNS